MIWHSMEQKGEKHVKDMTSQRWLRICTYADLWCIKKHESLIAPLWPPSWGCYWIFFHRNLQCGTAVRLYLSSGLYWWFLKFWMAQGTQHSLMYLPELFGSFRGVHHLSSEERRKTFIGWDFSWNAPAHWHYKKYPFSAKDIILVQFSTWFKNSPYAVQWNILCFPCLWLD